MLSLQARQCVLVYKLKYPLILNMGDSLTEKNSLVQGGADGLSPGLDSH